MQYLYQIAVRGKITFLPLAKSKWKRWKGCKQ